MIRPSVAAPVAEGAVFESGSTYRLIRRLGHGGMGEVWLAERRTAGGHGHRVAVKFLSMAGQDGSSLADEALRVSRLSHDNIVSFLDSGRDAQGRFFVALSFVEGVDLDGLRELAGIGPDAVCRGEAVARVPDAIVGFVLFMVLRALDHAHTFDFGDGLVGLVHRDVSPGNILIDEARGFVKLADFGVAVVEGSEPGQIAGKIPYMEPAVLAGGRPDARSDIYALGVVAYEFLTGFNPNVFPPHETAVLGAITQVMLSQETRLRPPGEVLIGVSPELSRIVTRMLDVRPGERYGSAEEALADVRSFLFDRGFGPTTSSLASYMAMLRAPETEPTAFMSSSLSFLPRDERGLPEVRPAWRLSPAARADLEAGRNPAREA